MLFFWCISKSYKKKWSYVFNRPSYQSEPCLKTKFAIPRKSNIKSMRVRSILSQFLQPREWRSRSQLGWCDIRVILWRATISWCSSLYIRGNSLIKATFTRSYGVFATSRSRSRIYYTYDCYMYLDSMLRAGHAETMLTHPARIIEMDA